MRYLAILLGVAIDLFVALMLFGTLVGGKILASLPIIIFFLLCGAGGTLLITKSLKSFRDERHQIEEKKVLGIIKQLGGRVSAIEVAAESDLSAKEADSLLRKLCINGYGEEQLGANDGVVYVFDGFLSDDERASSRKLLDV